MMTKEETKANLIEMIKIARENIVMCLPWFSMAKILLVQRHY